MYLHITQAKVEVAVPMLLEVAVLVGELTPMQRASAGLLLVAAADPGPLLGVAVRVEADAELITDETVEGQGTQDQNQV